MDFEPEVGVEGGNILNEHAAQSCQTTGYTQLENMTIEKMTLDEE